MTRDDASAIHITLRRRAWYVWLGWSAGTAWLILWLEVAIGSYRETEFHAFRLSMRIWLVSLLLGAALYVWGRRRQAQRGGGEAPGPEPGAGDSREPDPTAI